ncbi:Minor extracellular protease vpr precursor [Nocardioides dokdonensis FR1436]|uniref:Minor extracellular protease vpr n=1 Tax=Nocardioides dokdonensis FR1436 TaxID=1300347 RepID=A0A1A9GFA9_9ACTN|nr:S8 family serine peptidase [Nocardioides dokdonensis]ANH36944.1 Minor extracellular protease vpr precursor [Nocardioides dokdonensis FR1436]
MTRSAATHRRHGVRRALAAGTALAAAGAALLAVGTPTQALPGASVARTELYLVTLRGPGTSGSASEVGPALQEMRMRTRQQRLLDSVDAPDPVYRWTTALNGVAVELTAQQATRLAATPDVALVEPSRVRPLAAADETTSSGLSPSARTQGGRGVVIGFVDTGLDPDGPVFSSVPGLGPAPADFGGVCTDADDWGPATCNGKVVAGDWFVAGFGADSVRSSTSLSPRDDRGHGTAMASIAAGNSEVSVRVGEQSLGRYAGVAPQARIAVYKACWSAPDPADDGCATADLVTAIDRATNDGVDVLNLSVGGPPTLDTVETALLGAAEAGIVVVAAAGNGGPDGTAAHPSPWVTTVGASSATQREGRVRLGADGPRVSGAMLGDATVGPVRLVRGSDAASTGSSRQDAALCTPGSLDAALVADRVVLCERGGVGRVDKSAAVQRADGAGMILANTGPGSLDADFHSVPTVHLAAADADVVRRWAQAHPAGKVRLQPRGARSAPLEVLPFSGSGDPSAAVLKPDLVAPGAGIVGAVPAGASDRRWDTQSGTSPATAWTSGTAARLLARRDWSAPQVRSALATTADPVPGAAALDAGAGRVRGQRALRPGLLHDVDLGDYRAWLNGDLRASEPLNTASVLLSGGRSTTTRTVTNAGSRARYFSSSVGGFTAHDVSVTPAALRLGPGESATYTVRVRGGTRTSDDGFVLWRGSHGTRTRVPVQLSR